MEWGTLFNTAGQAAVQVGTQYAQSELAKRSEPKPVSTVAAPAPADKPGLPKWVIPAGIGAAVLVVAGLMLARR